MVRLLTDLYFPKFEEPGRPPELPTKIHLIYPYFRGGHYAHTLYQEYAVPLLCDGDERYFHTAYTTKLSSDLMMLSGRIHAAKSRGELDRLDLPPSVIARQQEFLEQQKNAPQQMAQFLQEMTRSLKGQRVVIQGATPVMLNDEWYNVIGGDAGEGAIIVFQIAEPVDFSHLLSVRVANLVPVDDLSEVYAPISPYTQTVGVYPESLKPEIRDKVALMGGQRFTSLGYAAHGDFASPQDAVEPLR